MKTLFACLLLSVSLLVIPAKSEEVLANCVTTDKFVADIESGIGTSITKDVYTLENTIKILLVFYKEFGIDISGIDPKKVNGSIFMKSERFPNAVIMILTAEDGRVACYNATISMKIYKYAVDKLGLTEI